MVLHFIFFCEWYASLCGSIRPELRDEGPNGLGHEQLRSQGTIEHITTRRRATPVKARENKFSLNTVIINYCPISFLKRLSSLYILISKMTIDYIEISAVTILPNQTALQSSGVFLFSKVDCHDLSTQEGEESSTRSLGKRFCRWLRL